MILNQLRTTSLSNTNLFLSSSTLSHRITHQLNFYYLFLSVSGLSPSPSLLHLLTSYWIFKSFTLPLADAFPWFRILTNIPLPDSVTLTDHLRWPSLSSVWFSFHFLFFFGHHTPFFPTSKNSFHQVHVWFGLTQLYPISLRLHSLST